ncbi:NAD(P)-dependent oxidoreductase [Prosthecomicrobium pneumaticum]|uniref:3-hydroxyisobutyrate dehydrogenase-like beta-hydroxyacid dehydrogenase n=1 Tax=Prosthecomicrobium pneumaticum TaxID=81895 RepID=A0A7W9L3R9_9HYPH|nr:DUF1932 domain-containing protein [Prosthecomicrobium pneumaticum]MBB5754839.1 3-hydroxyisobutyrate dehydrogenase-like beta-hydroxyacid dehydrogenase [Prosthecomicrobium pneumaticum]
MTPSIGMLGAGGMGAAIGRRLVDNGLTVRIALEGRSAASRERAAAAGMIPASDAEVAASDIILAVLPPSDAVAAAGRLAATIARAGTKPVYVDLNAIGPETAKAIGGSVEEAGAVFVDGSIIGFPPGAPDRPEPTLFLSGAAADRAAVLAAHGLTTKVVPGGIGAASALKMSYGGITKGQIALGASLILAAERAGAAAILRDELAASQAAVLAGYRRSIPDMLPKAARWVAEMEEIAAYIGPEHPEHAFFSAAAAFYRRIAADEEKDGPESEALRAFLKG